MKKIILLISLLLTVYVGYAQQLTVSGRVLDEEGRPLAGVTVADDATRNAVLTAADGSYSISTSTGATLVFSYLGMKEQRQPVSSSFITVTLIADALTLDQTVVVAYGTQRRSDMASSVASMRNEKLAEIPAYSIEQAMQGKMPGVRMAVASGVPGTSVVARVRGASSFSAGNDPLYVVDGVPVNSSTISFTNYGHENLSPLADLNPSDIASVEVLKDASAAALYGSRASNGVILITTKKGGYNQSKLQFDAYYGLQRFAKKLQLTDAKAWLEVQNEARENYNADNGYTQGHAKYVKPLGDPSNPLANVDWIDEITNSNAAVQSYQLSFSGGNDKTRSYLSIGYFGQDGLVKQNKYEKYSVRTNVDHRLKPFLKVGTNLSGSYMETNRIHGSNNIYSPWANALKQRPDEPAYNADGSYYPTTTNNPVQTLNEATYNTRRVRIIGSMYGLVDIAKGLRFNTQLGTDMSFLAERTYENSKSIQGKSSNGIASDGRSWMQQLSVENTLTYAKKLNRLSMDFLIGQSYQKNTSDYNSVSGKNFPSNDLEYLSSASLISGGTSSWSGRALLSYFARAKFMLHDRYVLEGSVRRDGSSKFSGSNRFGTFPSVAAAWIVDRESFFPQSNILTNLKLRSSFGLTGNQEGISDFASREQLSSSASYSDLPGFAVITKVNANLKWEKTRQLNVGMDLGFWNNRVSVAADYFNKTTVDLLMTRTLSSISGFAAMTDNIGSVRNQGLELLVMSRNLTGSFSWTTSLNLTHEWNRVLALNKTPNGEWVDMPTGWYQLHSVGHSIGSYYLIVSNGVYQSKAEIPDKLWQKGVRPGDMRYVDFNNDGEISDKDRQVVGAPEPKLYGGFDNHFTYKGFDLNIATYFSLGGKVYAMWASQEGAANLGYSLNAITQKAANNRWRGEGTSTDTPRAIYGKQGQWNTQASDRFFEDASFLKIKDVTLGYTLPSALAGQLGIQKLRIYVRAENLLTFAKYSGFDPEVMSAASIAGGADQGTQPQPRSFLFGINITL